LTSKRKRGKRKNKRELITGGMGAPLSVECVTVGAPVINNGRHGQGELRPSLRWKDLRTYKSPMRLIFFPAREGRWVRKGNLPAWDRRGSICLIGLKWHEKRRQGGPKEVGD